MSLRANKGKGNSVHRDEWETPQWLFDKLDDQYYFTFDCCASDDNTKCNVWSQDNFLYYDEAFTDDVHWMNPPFSKARVMFEHFFKVVPRGVCIFRCDNMETKLWQDIILKHASWILIPDKRINYEGMDGNGSVFPSALIGFNVSYPINIKGTILEVKAQNDD